MNFSQNGQIIMNNSTVSFRNLDFYGILEKKTENFLLKIINMSILLIDVIIDFSKN